VTDRDIRAHLRGAVKAGMLVGWYWFDSVVGLHYVVNPPGAQTSTYGHDEAVTYCQMLASAGVDPLYRN
jgi:hypothetical protein